MKITKEQLKQIIKEELKNVLEGQSEMLNDPSFIDPNHPMRRQSAEPESDTEKVKAAFKKFLRGLDAPSIIRGNDMMREYAEAFLASDEGSPWEGSVEVEDDFVGRGSRGGLFKLDYYQEDTGIPDAWDIGIWRHR